MVSDAGARAIGEDVERFLARTDIVPHVQCKALIGRLAAYVRDLEAEAALWRKNLEDAQSDLAGEVEAHRLEREARVRVEGERDERLTQLLYAQTDRDANFRLLAEANARLATLKAERDGIDALWIKARFDAVDAHQRIAVLEAALTLAEGDYKALTRCYIARQDAHAEAARRIAVLEAALRRAMWRESKSYPGCVVCVACSAWQGKPTSHREGCWIDAALAPPERSRVAAPAEDAREEDR